MLQHAHRRRLDGGEVLLLLEEHADEGRTRHRLVDEASTLLPARRRERLAREAGTVMREGGSDAGVRRLVAHGGGIGGEVASLGVTSHIDPALGERRGSLEVADGARLRGHARLEGHVEVFLPADDGVVGTAERDVDVSRGKAQRTRRELLLAIEIGLRDVVAETNRPEARARNDGAEQPDEPLGVPEPEGEPLEPVGAIEVDDRHALMGARGGGDVGKLVVRDAGEHEAVDVGNPTHVKAVELRREIRDDVVPGERRGRPDLCDRASAWGGSACALHGHSPFWR